MKKHNEQISHKLFIFAPKIYLLICPEKLVSLRLEKKKLLI